VLSTVFPATLDQLTLPSYATLIAALRIAMHNVATACHTLLFTRDWCVALQVATGAVTSLLTKLIPWVSSTDDLMVANLSVLMTSVFVD